MDRPYAPQLSAHALSTPEPLVRAFARRVQQEGALDLTQGDYKNADFAPHPEVVRGGPADHAQYGSQLRAGGRAHGRAQRDRRVLQPRRPHRLPVLRRPVPARRGPLHVGHPVGPRDGAGGARRRRHGRRGAPAELGVRLVRGARRQAPGRTAHGTLGVPARPGATRPPAGGRRDLVGHHQQSAQSDGPGLPARARRVAGGRLRAARRVRRCTTRSTSASTTSAAS